MENLLICHTTTGFAVSGGVAERQQGGFAFFDNWRKLLKELDDKPPDGLHLKTLLAS